MKELSLKLLCNHSVSEVEWYNYTKINAADLIGGRLHKVEVGC